MTRFTTVTLVVQLISNQTNLLISLKRFRGSSSEYTVKVKQRVISNIQVQGYCFPLLVIGWGDTELVDKMTGKKAVLKGAFRIPIITAFLAKRILSHPHVFKLGWLTPDKRIEEVGVEKGGENIEDPIMK